MHESPAQAWIPDGDKLVGNPFEEKATALTQQAEIGSEELRCLDCDEPLPYQPGTVRKYCNKTCRKRHRAKGRRKTSQPQKS